MEWLAIVGPTLRCGDQGFAQFGCCQLVLVGVVAHAWVTVLLAGKLHTWAILLGEGTSFRLAPEDS